MKRIYLLPKISLYFTERVIIGNFLVLLNFFFYETVLPFSLRQFFGFFFKNVKKSVFSTRIKLRCLVTNNPRIYNSKYGLSRRELRRCCLLGRLEGFIKSS